MYLVLRVRRVPLVRDGKLGESVAQAELLLNRHRDLQETILAHQDKFNALRRITLVSITSWRRPSCC